jgi:hypothetical protein
MGGNPAEDGISQYLVGALSICGFFVNQDAAGAQEWFCAIDKLHKKPLASSL